MSDVCALYDIIYASQYVVGMAVACGRTGIDDDVTTCSVTTHTTQITVTRSRTV